MPNYLDNLDVINANGDVVNVKIRDSETLALANKTFNYLRSIAVNVVEEGADNTGDNDCSSVLNELVSTYSALYFPSGKYKIDNAINLNSNVYIFGSNAEIICDSVMTMFNANNQKYIHIMGINFKCVSDSLDGEVAISCVESSDVYINNCTFNNHGAGVYTIDSSRINVTNCIFEKCENCAILFDGDKSNLEINNNNLAYNNYLNDNGIFGNILGRYGTNIVIDSNTCHYGKMHLAMLQNCNFSVIRNNYSKNTKYEGYNLQDCAGCVVENNICEWDNESGFGDEYGKDFGISIWGTHDYGNSNQNIIRNNVVNNSYKAGIAVWGECNGTDVSNNKVINSPNIDYDPDGDGGGAGIKIGQTSGETGVPFGTFVNGNYVFAKSGMRSIESMLNGLSSNSVIKNNDINTNIVSAENDVLNDNGYDVVNSFNVNSNGVTGAIFYSKKDTAITFTGFLTVSSATNFAEITLPFAPKEYLKASAINANRVAGGTSTVGYSAYINDAGKLIICGADGQIPSDGSMYIYGEYFYL